ncbi:MAG: hypothetical protein ACREFT_04305, partial [Acetobacteraceae bacterium]
MSFFAIAAGSCQGRRWHRRRRRKMLDPAIPTGKKPGKNQQEPERLAVVGSTARMLVNEPRQRRSIKKPAFQHWPPKEMRFQSRLFAPQLGRQRYGKSLLLPLYDLLRQERRHGLLEHDLAFAATALQP